MKSEPEDRSSMSPGDRLQKARQSQSSKTPQRREFTKADRRQGRREVSRLECYPVEEFLKRTGLSQQAWRDARLAGLRIVKLGDSYWITGEEWFRWLQETAEYQSPLKKPRGETAKVIDKK